MNKNVNSFKVKYRATDGKIRTKAIKAMSKRGALCNFKRIYGIKGISATRAYTKAERAEIDERFAHNMAAIRDNEKTPTYFDGRTYVTFDGGVAVETTGRYADGYTH